MIKDNGDNMGLFDRFKGKSSGSSSSGDSRIVPIKESGLDLSAVRVCDVCGKPLDLDKTWFVPNDIFYSSEKYKKWFKEQPMFSMAYGDADVNSVLDFMRSRDPSQGSAICEDCIHLFR
jgi:hypothetical protein